MPVGAATSAGLRSSARRSSTRRCSSSATSSSGTGSATTRASRRARTTTCGRACSTWRTATTLPSRSSSTASTPRRRRSAAASSSASASFGSRAARSRAIAPELSADEVGARLAGRRRRARSTPDEVDAARRRVPRARRRVRATESGRGARARAARDARAGRRRSASGAHAHGIAAARAAARPGLPAARPRRGVATRSRAGSARREAEGWLRRLAGDRRAAPIRVAAVFPEPTPYRAPLLDRVAALAEIDLTVIYAAGTVAGRTWRVEPKHRAVFLRGVRIPGAQRVLHHDYPVTPGVVGALDGRAARRRRRLGLEHVRRAGRDRLVRAARTSRTSSSSRATTRGRAPAGGER